MQRQQDLLCKNILYNGPTTFLKVYGSLQALLAKVFVLTLGRTVHTGPDCAGTLGRTTSILVEKWLSDCRSR